MANVTGESAEAVSSYMTAIWNNFADGSESLEHYADVITELGAATASSSEEIAEGLQKFASIGSTVGLSYDYATSALATVVAETRQSADVVGTAFKTLFARIQDLELGDTLEDGTTLGTYSQALEAIGVNIKDANGEVKDMDDILDEMGAKWQTISKDEQIAVAQAVAGTRQYTQLVALMDKWDVFKENLSYAQNSDGSLQEQADIYAESWEAAEKRVKAAAQSIYSDLIDDKFFIGLSNGSASFLEGVDEVINDLGGLKGVLSDVSSVFLLLYAQKMPVALNNLKQNFLVLTGQAEKAMISVQDKTNAYLQSIQSDPNVSTSFKVQAEGISKVNEMQQRLIINSKNMTEAEQADYKARIQNVQAMYNEAAALAKENEELEKRASTSVSNLATSAMSGVTGLFNDYNQSEETVSLLESKIANAGQGEDTTAYQAALEQAKVKAAELEIEITKVAEAYGFTNEEISELVENNGKLSPKQIQCIKAEVEKVTTSYKNLVTQSKQLETFSNGMESQANIWKQSAAAIDKDSDSVKALKVNMTSYLDAIKEMAQNSGIDIQGKELQELEQVLNNSRSTAMQCAEAFDKFQLKMEDASGANSLTGVIDNLSGKIETLETRMSTMKFDSNGLVQVRNDAEAAAESTVKLGESMQNAGHQGDVLPNMAFKASTAMTQFASAAMSTYTLIESLSRGFKTFQEAIDGNATVLETISSVVSIAMTAMMAYNSVIAVSNTLLKSQWVLNTAKIVTDKGLVAAELLLRSTEEGTVAAKLADLAATIALEVACESMLVAVLATTAALAVLIISIAAIVKAIKAFKVASPEGQLKSMQEQASSLSEALSDAKQAVEDLASAFDTYDSAIETLENCTKGTQEWKDALLEVNNTVLDLLHTYPQLAEYISRDKETGQLSISDEGKQAMEDAASQAAVSAQGAYNTASQDVRNQQISIQKRAINSKLDNDTVQSVFSQVSDSLVGKTTDEMRTILTDAFKNGTYESVTSNWSDETINNWVDKIIEQSDSIEELTSAIQENTLATETENQTVADNILSSDEKVQNSKYAEEITSASGNIYDQLEKQASKNLEDDGWGTKGISKRSGVNDEATKIFEEYTTAAGIQGATLTDVTGSDSNRKFVYEDSEGNEKSVSLEVMRAMKAAADAADQLITSAEGLITTFTELDDSGQKYDEALKAGLSDGGNLEGATKEEVKALQDLVDGTEGGMSAVLGTKFGNNDGTLTDDEAQSLGYESAQIMIDAFNQGLTDYSSAEADIGKNWLQSVQNAFSSLDTSSLSLTEQEVIGEAMETAMINSGSTEAFTELFNAIPIDKTDEFANTLNDIDWSDTDVNDLSDALEKAGISTVGLDDELQALIDTMSNDGIKTAEELGESYKAVTDITSGLSTGDTISSDDYNTLGDNAQNYFTMMMDGTYKLIGSAEELNEVIQQEGISDYQENISKLEEKQLQYKSIANYDKDTVEKTASKGTFNGAYDTEVLEQQLEILEAMDYDAEQLAKWQEKASNGTINANSLKEIASAVSEYDTQLSDMNSLIEENQTEINSQQLAIAMSYNNIEDLTEAYKEGTISTQAYNAAVQVLKEEADLEGLDTEELSDYADYLQEICKESEELSDELADNDEAAQDVAKTIMKMNQGIESLADGFDDWSDVLKKSSKESEEYFEAMSDMKDALEDILGVESDYISDDFVTDHLDDIAKAATGDADAIDALKSSLSEEVLLQISVGKSDDVVSEINSLADEVNAAVNNLSVEDIEVGATIQDADFLEAANNLVSNAEMTADDANAYFGSIGYEPLYSEEDVDTSMETPAVSSETTFGLKWNPVTLNLPDFLGGDTSINLPQIALKTTPIAEEPVPSKGSMKLVGFSGDGTPPQIKGFRKLATGSSNNYSSKNSGGKSLGSSGKSSGGSGGSSGSSSKPSKKDHEKHDDSEADLYHEIKESIKDVEHEVNKLDKTQSHLYGGKLISSLKAENALLSQQRANYAELNREIEERQSAIKKTLSQYGDVDDYYTTYNNIQAAYNSAVDDYNALIDEYNSLTKEQQEANDDVIDSAKDALDENKDAMDKALDYLKEYYDNKEELRSNDEKRQELLYQQIENNLEAYETEIELKLDTTEAERSLAEFLKSMQTDIKNTYKTSSEWGADFAADQTNANTHAQDAQTHMSQLAKYKQMYANKQWGGESDIFASETDALKAITDLEQTILEDGNTLLEDYEDIYDDLIDAFDETIDQFEDIIDDFDRIDDTLDHYQKVNELLYGDSTIGMTNAATSYQVAAENSIARQSALNQYIQTLQQRRAEAIAKGYDEDDDYIKNIDDEIDNKTSELESAIEDYIDTIQSELENAIQMAKETMDKTMWGGSLTDIQQEWDDKKSMAEDYYDEVEKIYELESLENKWQSAINSTSSLKAQKQLKDLMEKQVSALESKTDLSEKDVELAEKEIAVYQAQIALEEAQNSKNAMKLTRDESGNWSYQYIADEDDVADKQQSYLDKLNEYRTAAVSATEEIEESIINAYSDFTERMAEIMTDVTLTDEERATKIEELNATYYGEDGIITKAVEDSNYLQQVANQATFEELWGLYQSDSEYYEQMTDTEKSLIDSLRGQGIESYTNLRNFIIGSDKKSGAYGDILETAKSVNKDCEIAWNSMAANAIEKMYGKDGKLDKTSVTGIVQQAYKDMQAAFTTYNNAIIASEKASGTEWSKVGIQLVGTDGNSGVKGQIDTVASAVQGVVDKISSLSEFESKVLEIENAWYSVGTSIQSATSDLDTYLSLLNGGSVVNFNSSSKKNGNNFKSTSLSNSSNSSNVASSSSSGGDGILSVGDTATFSGKYYSSPEGASPTGGKYSGVNNGIVVDIINDNYGEYSCHIRSAYDSDDDLGWVKKSQLSGYDTGGYTGSWDGGNGRLALLHSKELVLNADDTSNFLTAVSAVRDIANLGNISNSIASGVASLVKSMLGFDNNFKGTYGNKDDSAGGNTFNITAEFPNANNTEEIREAIMSLPTLASQYLSRNSL